MKSLGILKIYKMATKNLWTREELILTFNLYLKLPFGKLHSRTSEVIQLANLLGRTPNSIAIRLTNFAACDPYHRNRGVKGMEGGIKQCQPVWDEFSNNKEALIFESEKILAEKENQTIEIKYGSILDDIKELKGEIKLTEVKTRVNQNFFRQLVLANYGSKCAINGIDIPELLIASHIVPWSKNKEVRLNPENGICLSPLYDRAFDLGIIGIKPNFQVVLSSKIKSKYNLDFFRQDFSWIEGIKINKPVKYLPKKEFLEYHLDVIFLK